MEQFDRAIIYIAFIDKNTEPDIQLHGYCHFLSIDLMQHYHKSLRCGLAFVLELVLIAGTDVNGSDHFS